MPLFISLNNAIIATKYGTISRDTFANIGLGYEIAKWFANILAT